MAGQHETAFNRLGNDFCRAACLELFQIPVIYRAHNHRHGGSVGVGVGKHFQGAGGIQVRHHDRTGPRQTGCDQRLQTHCVTKNHRITCCCCLTHPIRVQVQRDVRNAFVFQQAAQVLTAAAITANDDVFIDTHGFAGNCCHLQRLM